MCILFIAVNQHPDYPLIIAANRDEFHARPTSVSHWWNSNSNLLAGKDEQAGGTWMGITRSGRFAALTNIRDPDRVNPNAHSRGELVVNALTDSPEHFTRYLVNNRNVFNGFNLLYGTVDHLQAYNNFNNRFESVGTGVHGLSNASLNAPWPKTTKGMAALSAYCKQSSNIENDELFAILRDEDKALDSELPQTGVSYQWEKQLSSTFIRTPEYGTRCSTVLLVGSDGLVSWHERSFDHTARITSEQSYEFTLVSSDVETH